MRKCDASKTHAGLVRDGLRLEDVSSFQRKNSSYRKPHLAVEPSLSSTSFVRASSITSPTQGEGPISLHSRLEADGAGSPGGALAAHRRFNESSAQGCPERGQYGINSHEEMAARSTTPVKSLGKECSIFNVKRKSGGSAAGWMGQYSRRTSWAQTRPNTAGAVPRSPFSVQRVSASPGKSTVTSLQFAVDGSKCKKQEGLETRFWNGARSVSYQK